MTEEVVALSAQEAFAAIAACTMHADGHLEVDEDAVIMDELAALPEFEGTPTRGIREVLVRVDALARVHGDDGLVRLACASLPSARREAAYALACAVAQADEEEDEDTLLARLRRLLRPTA